ncbi:MAG: nucleotide pyrophosphohydrolase [Candidatus Hermodarchaeota archaeon]
MVGEYTLPDIQNMIHDWITKHGGYWSPLAMMSAIIEEIGELAREINHLEGFKPKKNLNGEEKIGEELADVLYALICIANYYKIDLNLELNTVIKKYSKRDSNRFI